MEIVGSDKKDLKNKPKDIKEVRVCKNKTERAQLKGIACKECQEVFL